MVQKNPMIQVKLSGQALIRTNRKPIQNNQSKAMLLFKTYTPEAEAVFTVYRIVKRSVAENVPDRASVHTRNAAFGAVSAPEQYCSALLLC